MITKSILKQYRYLLIENADLEERIKRTREQLDKLERSGNVVDTVKGGEGGIQHFKIEGFPVAEYSQKKTRLLSQMLRYEKNLAKINELVTEVGDFIDNIPDARARVIFKLYYEDGLSQQEISFRLHADQSWVSREIDKNLSKLA